ncbi:TraB/GumN family protein [Caulobacter sp. 17J65-9]|uniref:TraB/GumN family protein n=1 Tax=Caulobacter sp. 17J65-9 TaxID=2709382 RepID=UPI0013CD08FD|nr:TraB/GumN family protein [Caulobacter sp. 17J65-9]NEX93014.1 TraB/GumN family protein [Caulobacter sp. 17J65-9]
MHALLSKVRAAAAPIANRTAGLALGVFASASLLAGAASAEPAVWVVKDKDSTIYLVGTVHLLKSDAAWRTPKIEKAIADSTELWLEMVDVDNPAAMAPLVQKYGMDPAKPLSAKLTPEQNAKLAAVAGKYGVDPANLQQLRPWYVGLLFTVIPLHAAGFDPNNGVDKLIKAQADKEGDTVKGFETMEQQIRLFADLPEADQVDFLVQSLDDASDGVEVLDKLAKAWEAGDVDTIAKVMNAEMKADAPELYDRLLTQRNIRWADQIQTLLKGSGTQLVAVGGGHLAGPDSVQAQLKKRGVKAKRL